MEKIKTQAQVFYAYTIGNARIKSMSTSNIDSVELRDVSLLSKKFSNQCYFKPGDTLSYTILLTNQGNYLSKNIVINDDLKMQTFLDDSINIFSLKNEDTVKFSHKIKENNLVVEIDSINAQDTIALTYQTISNLSDSPYSISTAATISSDEISHFETNKINIETKYADIIISKRCATEYTYYNTDITYMISLENKGNLEADELEVVDQLPITFELANESPILVNEKEVKNYSLDEKTKILRIPFSKAKAKTKYEIKIKGKIVK